MDKTVSGNYVWWGENKMEADAAYAEWLVSRVHSDKKGAVEATMVCCDCESSVAIFIPKETLAQLQYLIGAKSKRIRCLACQERRQDERLGSARDVPVNHIRIDAEDGGSSLSFRFFRGRPKLQQVISILKSFDDSQPEPVGSDIIT